MDFNRLMNALGQGYSTVNGKKPRNSDRQMPAGMNSPEINALLKALNNNIRENTGQNAIDRKIAMRDLDAMAGGDLQQARAANNKDLTQKMIDVGLNFNPAAVAQTVWHGSPHKFDKFDMSKIGTGEGAQAYGHGLYLAESPDVAGSYAQSVKANSGELVKRGAAHGLPEDVASNLAAALQSGKKFDPVIDAARKMIDDPLASASQRAAAQRLIDNEMAAYNAWSEWSKPGQLYKVDLPDEQIAKMLDWDKPLSQQHPDVQKALQSMTNDVVTGGFDLSRAPRNLARAFDNSVEEQAIKQVQEKYGLTNSGGSWFDKNGNPIAPDAVSKFVNKKIGAGYNSAGDLYSDLTHVIGDQGGVSAALNNNGIPGIRYLDGGSRGQQVGTSNFVLFDDQMPRILEVNGQATGAKPWKPGEYK